jgi:hypothetical protein
MDRNAVAFKASELTPTMVMLVQIYGVSRTTFDVLDTERTLITPANTTTSWIFYAAPFVASSSPSDNISWR